MTDLDISLVATAAGQRDVAAGVDSDVAAFRATGLPAAIADLCE